MGTWFNPDGLYRKFGTTKAIPATGGEYKTYGDWREIELRADLTGLTTTPVILSDVVFYPLGMRLQEVEVYVETAGVPGAATSINLGLMQTDRSTVISASYFLLTSVVADHTPAGKKTVYTTGAGIATPSTVPGYITLAAVAGTYTSGFLKFRIRYFKLNTN
jgi:hypothetical protein